jgi:oligoendopeptidase F
MDLGWTREKANYIADKISVDPSRGAGHAWGAEMKGDVAHLRTRVGEKGMDYKGYNIAIHELGHNVEQTITLYDIDYYTLRGVPNTGFTEAVAFMLQANDLKLLGQSVSSNRSEADALAALDNCWSSFEIMGVALVDMYVWQWMYQNPDANPKELKEAVNAIAIDVWNKYYAPVFGVEDSPILGVYSHMIASPLYLANYPVGHLIEFQVEQYIQNKQFADEITRMLLQGRITPQEWMKGAVGSEISGKPTLKTVKEALRIVN